MGEYVSRLEVIQAAFKQREVSIVVPESEFPELIVTVPDSWPYIKLAPLYDVHYGHQLHASTTFIRHLDWIANREPYVLTWNGGDLVENAVLGSPGIFSQRFFSQEQHEGSIELASPIQHKMLFAIPGNHEYRTYKNTGFDLAKQFATDLRIPYFSDYCLPPEVRVLTNDFRWIPLGEVFIGQKLLAFDEEAPTTRGRGRKWQVAEVEDVFPVRRYCYRIHLANGENIIASSEHRWLVTRSNPSHYRWEETKDLVVNERGTPASLVKMCDVWKERTDFIGGYLQAAFDGEGTVRQYRGEKPWYALGVSFAQRNNAMLKNVKEGLTELGFKWRCDPHTTPNVFNLDIRGGVSEYLRFLGSVRPQRLIDDFDLTRLGRISAVDRIRVEQIEDVGIKELVAIRTSTGTFLAEGYATHNCFCTIKWRGNNFRLCAHHGTGAAQTPGAQLNAARKDLPWVGGADLFWTGHLHQAKTDTVFRSDFNQRTGEMVTRMAFVIISPSYLRYFGGYGAAKRLSPGAIGLTVVELEEDGTMKSTQHAKGKRL